MTLKHAVKVMKAVSEELITLTINGSKTKGKTYK